MEKIDQEIEKRKMSRRKVWIVAGLTLLLLVPALLLAAVTHQWAHKVQTEYLPARADRY